MTKWPLIQRNKVEDSKIRVPVQACTESDNEAMKSLALKVIHFLLHGTGADHYYSFSNTGSPSRLRTEYLNDSKLYVFFFLFYLVNELLALLEWRRRNLRPTYRYCYRLS